MTLAGIVNETLDGGGSPVSSLRIVLQLMMKAHYRQIIPGIVNGISERDRVLEVAAGTGLITYEAAGSQGRQSALIYQRRW